MTARRTGLDPATLALIHQGPVAVAQEMGGVLKRSSYRPIIRDMEYFS